MSSRSSLQSRLSAAAALLITMGLAACATPPAPTPAPVVATVAPPDKAPPPPPRPVAPKPVDLRWAFTATPELCTALASGPGGSFQIQTTAARKILLTAKFTSTAPAAASRARTATLRFTGPAGDWSMPGTWQQRAFASSRSLDELGVASVLSLLGGGTAAVTAGPLTVGSARLPPSSGEGSAWVQCPKHMMAAG